MNPPVDQPGKEPAQFGFIDLTALVDGDQSWSEDTLQSGGHVCKCVLSIRFTIWQVPEQAGEAGPSPGNRRSPQGRGETLQCAGTISHLRIMYEHADSFEMRKAVDCTARTLCS